MAMVLLSLMPPLRVLCSTLPALAAPAPSGLRVYRDIFPQSACSVACMAPRPASLPPHFAAFTYIELAADKSAGVPATALSGLLLLSGFPGCWVTLSQGKLIDRHPEGLIFAALLLGRGALAILAPPPVLRHCHSVLAGYC